jgi:hypothetical protein
MSSILRRGDTFRGVSVDGCGVFKSGYGSTYAGQHRNGYACGLAVVTLSNGAKDYAEHGPDGWSDGRYLSRWTNGNAFYRLFERGTEKGLATVYADGRCYYNNVACARDDPRLLALTALVAPVEVRPTATARHPPSPPSSPPSNRPMRRLVLRRRRSPPPWPPRCNPHAARRREGPCNTTQQQPHCQARPRSDACTDSFPWWSHVG